MWQIYDLMFENSWRGGPIDIVPWLASYATRRYAVAGEQTGSPAAHQAWVALFADVYSDKNAQVFRNRPPTNMLNRPPSTVVSNDHFNGVRRGLGLGRAWLQVNGPLALTLTLPPPLSVCTVAELSAAILLPRRLLLNVTGVVGQGRAGRLRSGRSEHERCSLARRGRRGAWFNCRLL